MDTTESLNHLTQYAVFLESAVVELCTQVSHPIFSEDPAGHFVFEKPDTNIFAVLRCVRIAADIKAVICLLQNGFIQQTGILLRCIVEFSHDLDFIVEGFINPESLPRVNERISQFFSEEYRDTKQLMEDTKKSLSTPRKNIYAAVGRLIGPENTHRYRQIAKILEEIYSGYVHGNYHHTMELYNGLSVKFEMGPIQSKINQWIHYSALVIQPIFNQFSTVASAFGLDTLKDSLIDKRKTFEVLDLYTGG